MPTNEQLRFDDYQLKEVNVRLVLKESGTMLYSSRPITRPDIAVDVMADVLKEMDREMVCVVNLDTHGRAINYNVVSIGGINSGN